jgi:uncharacterized membrane protein
MNTNTLSTVDVKPELVRTLHIIYALHALGLVLGAFGAASVIGSFLFGWPSIIAVIVSYIYRGDARGTWLESHFSWAIRTFWYALIWAVLVALISLPLTLVVIGFGTWIVGLFILGLWAIYRVARGWMRLNSRQAMPQ